MITTAGTACKGAVPRYDCGLGFFMGQGWTPHRAAHASYKAFSALTFCGFASARLFSSVRSASMSYNSHPPGCLETSFHLPFRTARLPSCSQYIASRSISLLLKAGARLLPSSGVILLPLYSAGYLAAATSTHVAIVSIRWPGDRKSVV